MANDIKTDHNISDFSVFGGPLYKLGAWLGLVRKRNKQYKTWAGSWCYNMANTCIPFIFTGLFRKNIFPSVSCWSCQVFSSHTPVFCV